MPSPSLFLTPKPHRQTGASRRLDTSPPIILRRGAHDVPVSERDARTIEVLNSESRASSNRDERKAEMPPAVSGFDDDDFILAVPSEVGMVSRDSSFCLEAGYETDATATGSLRCVMDEFSWELSTIAQDYARESEEVQVQDQAQEVRFRPIRESDAENHTVEKPRFKLPRTSLRLQPRPSRVDWEDLQSANPFL
jgi:putative hemolysin